MKKLSILYLTYRTWIGDIAADIADVMLSIAAELAPRPKRPRGPQSWCADPGVQAEMNAAWQHGHTSAQEPKGKPHE